MNVDLGYERGFDVVICMMFDREKRYTREKALARNDEMIWKMSSFSFVNETQYSSKY